MKLLLHYRLCDSHRQMSSKQATYPERGLPGYHKVARESFCKDNTSLGETDLVFAEPT